LTYILLPETLCFSLAFSPSSHLSVSLLRSTYIGTSFTKLVLLPSSIDVPSPEFSCFKQRIDHTNSCSKFKSDTSLLPSSCIGIVAVSPSCYGFMELQGRGDLYAKILYLHGACNCDAPIEIVQIKCQTDLAHTNPDSLTSRHYSAFGGFCSLLVPQWLLPSSRSVFIVYCLLLEHIVAAVRAKGE
jgi:hypothetical protein